MWHTHVQVQCYQRWGPGRRSVFRAQFHTGELQGERLRLGKEELDLACRGGGTAGSPRGGGGWEAVGSVGVMGAVGGGGEALGSLGAGGYWGSLG